ncbi:unnamed protein product [Peronospora destructor]|uniref:Uncharacterized protein n=1 Tax=Peronospora destructor TaxID=86335 RepID=A0AAV0SZX0_9STRA|nr:unnamed protein product [Peronospora destructor]
MGKMWSRMELGREAMESLKQQHVFVDDKWSKHRAVTDVDVSPFYPELTLIAYGDYGKVWCFYGLQHCRGDQSTDLYAIRRLWSGIHVRRVYLFRRRLCRRFSYTHPIYAMAVVGTKNSYTLISASTDGRVCVWDIDHLQKPLDMLDLRISLSIVSNYTSVNASNRKMEASVTSFAVLGKEIKELFIGTEAGKLYSTKVDQQKKKLEAGDDNSGIDADKRNRNSLLGSSTGGLVREVIVEAVSKEGSHFGPVTAMHFNPLLPIHRDSLLLTCSLDSTVKLWSSEHPESPVLSFEPSSEYISDVRWSSVHPALFAVADSSGTVSIWNILKDIEVPVISEKISEKSLNKVRWSADGKSVITGDANGTSYIYGVPSVIALPQQDDLSLLEDKMTTFSAAAAVLQP